MVSMEALAEAMGELEEDTVVELLEQVMEEGVNRHWRLWTHVRKAWISSEAILKRANIL